MNSAIASFELRCRDDPFRILHQIGFRAQPSELEDEFARNCLIALQKRALKNKSYYTFGPRRSKHKESLWDRVALVGCAVVGFLVMSAIVAGLQELGTLIWSQFK